MTVLSASRDKDGVLYIGNKGTKLRVQIVEWDAASQQLIPLDITDALLDVVAFTDFSEVSLDFIPDVDNSSNGEMVLEEAEGKFSETGKYEIQATVSWEDGRILSTNPKNLIPRYLEVEKMHHRV